MGCWSLSCLAGSVLLHGVVIGQLLIVLLLSPVLVLFWCCV
jgi:hypothetical protein